MDRGSHRTPIHIDLLGEIAVRDGTRTVELPPSKKTRALLAYLVLTQRPQRRDRLCSLLWDVADDPRGALRWSLSKLRKLVNAPGRERLVSDRELVSFVAEDADVDVFAVRRALSAGLQSVDTDCLVALTARYRGELLEGMDLADFDEFQAWCVAEREQARRERAALLRELVGRLASEPERAARYARELVRVEPLDQPARAHLIQLLAGAGCRDEAEQHYRSAQRLFKELGASMSNELTRAYQQLRGGAGDSKVRERAPAPGSSAPEVPSSRASRLVGRRAELAFLEGVIERAVEARQVQIVLVTGEPGAGKSRLLTELGQRVRDRCTVLTGRAFEAERERPYGPWLDAFRRVSDNPLSGWPDASAERSRDRFFDAVADWIRQRAAACTVLMLIDDLHWCDDASATLLHHVVRSNADLPMLLVLAARDGELPDNDGAMRLVRSLRRNWAVERLSLSLLGPEETAELARSVVEDAEVERIYRESAGNPLFVLQLASAETSSSVAPTLNELIRDRLQRLPEEALDVLRWCAVLGQAFGVGRLGELCALDPGALARALQTLERHALVQVADGAPDKYGFSHDIVRRVVYAELSAPRRQLMHRQVARLLSSAEGGGPTDEVALHASLAGDAGLAAAACSRAAKRAIALFAPAEAHALARRGMRFAAELPEPERTERMLELLETSFAARRPADVDAAAATAEELAERALDYGKLEHARRGFHLLGYLRWESGDWGEAERRMLQAEMVSRSGDGPSRVVAMAEAAGCLLLLERDLPQAEALSAEARATAERLGVESPAVHDATGMLLLHRGELRDALAHFEKARVLARRDRDRLGEFRSLEHMIRVEMLLGRSEAACQLCTDLLALGGKMREGSEEPFAQAVAALCGLAQGDETRWGSLDAAIDALRLVDAKHRLGFALTQAAELELACGRAERAGQRASEALRMAGMLKHTSDEALARVVALRAARALGDVEEVERHERELDRCNKQVLASHVRQAVVEALPEGRA